MLLVWNLFSYKGLGSLGVLFTSAENNRFCHLLFILDMISQN